MRQHAYAPLIAILRSGMRHAGVLRIDHILGLQRSFWWPAARGLAGAYVRQPVEDLLGIVTLESHRQRCMVVGEDLGTVPGGLRKALEASGVLGCSVLYFERCEGGFLPAARYRSGSIASIGTHDLPTLAGFWAGRDIDWREKLGLYKDPEQVGLARRERQVERRALLRLLADEGLLPPGTEPGDLSWPLVLALHRLLARSPAKLMALQIEDVLGTVEQANLPGTTHQHPNWCRRLDCTLEDLDRSRPLRELAESIAGERPRSEPGSPA
jgi:4-alpha-glucanotransferase